MSALDSVGWVTCSCFTAWGLFSFLATVLPEMRKQNIMIFVITISGVSCRQI